jgi:hypothetical protein
MSELTYYLRFARPETGLPIAATGQIATTTIGDDGAVETNIELAPGKASYEVKITKDPDDPTRFTETGTLSFEGTGGAPQLLLFTTLGSGRLFPPASPDSGPTLGTVMWEITNGTGVFEGARGVITSNFRLDEDDGALLNDQVAWIRLPD